MISWPFVYFCVALLIVSWLVARLLAGTRLHLFLFPFGILVVLAIGWLAMPTYMGGLQPPKDGGMGGNARILAMCLYEYALDNNDPNPLSAGHSSTAVFQKLIDGGYTNDPGIFYLHLPGKHKCKTGERLLPENVCWDLVQATDGNLAGDVPLVFPTGYRVTFTAGGPAVPRSDPYPLYGDREVPSAWDRYHAWPMPNIVMGLGVGYLHKHTAFLKLTPTSSGGWVIPNFIPADFDSTKQTYRQLTPEGELPH